jgi:hypothetical protein
MISNQLNRRNPIVSSPRPVPMEVVSSPGLVPMEVVSSPRPVRVSSPKKSKRKRPKSKQKLTNRILSRQKSQSRKRRKLIQTRRIKSRIIISKSTRNKLEKINKFKNSMVVANITSDYYNLLYCLNKSGECINFGRKHASINFFKFNNFTYVVNTKPIGQPSANGFVTEIHYEREGLNSYAVLKSSRKASADNLYYEYLVGIFINYWNQRFPCFVETYGLYVRNNLETTINKEDLHQMKLIPLNAALSSDTIATACEKSSYLSILIQHIHDAKPINIYKKEMNTELVGLLYQVYAPLAYLMREFTHYDLHNNNVLLYPLDEEEYIELIYVYSATKQITLYCNYICKIIDYGRSFINKPETISLYDKLCNEPKCNNEDNKNKCGKSQGFKWFNDNPVWINSRVSNISHDLRLANIFLKLKNRNIIYEDYYGTPALETINDSNIRNVMDMKNELEIWLTTASYLKFQQEMLSKTKKATLTIYLDGSDKPMNYSP